MTKHPIPYSILKHPAYWLATGFGSGLAPKAPGTFGTLAAVPLVSLGLLLPWTGYLALLLLAVLVGIYVCDKTARDWRVHDHPAIVWDEFVGLGITLFLLEPNPYWIALGFVWFRVFDIAKPWPISWLDRHVHGGLGIMLDDILAGVFAWVALQASVLLWHWVMI